MDESEFKVESGIYVVKFTATWCGPCKKIAPALIQLETEFPDIKFISVDIDQVSSLPQKYKVRSLPTLLVLKNGEEVNRIVGLSLIDPMRKIFRDLTKQEQIIDIQAVSV